jgi:hypothetical protein
MEVGENHDVIVCTFDETGRPAPTEPAGFRLGWELDSDDPSRPAVAFNPDPPPADTAGPAATAQAGLDGVAPGETSIRVTLLDSSGLVVDTFSVSVRVLFNGDRIVATDVTARVGRRSIRGTVRAAQPECERGRSVKLFRRVRRVGELVGIAESNARGRWRVVTGRTPGVYYARAVAASRTDEEWGDILSCLRGDGKNVRRR